MMIFDKVRAVGQEWGQDGGVEALGVGFLTWGWGSKSW